MHFFPGSLTLRIFFPLKKLPEPTQKNNIFFSEANIPLPHPGQNVITQAASLTSSYFDVC